MKKYLSNSRIFLILIPISILVFSCKSTKISSSTALNKKASVIDVLTLHKLKKFQFNTLQSRLKVAYNDGKKSVSPSVSLRVEKDKQIWISAKVFGFTVAKIYITPNRVAFYEKLNKRFYEGDFKTVSRFLGFETNFEKIQNLLLGQSIVDEKSQDLTGFWKDPNQFEIKLKKQKELYNWVMLINQILVKVDDYELLGDKKKVKITYESYQMINNQSFPKKLMIKTSKPNAIKKIDIEFKDVSINGSLTFPYTTPTGYSAFRLN